MERRIEVANERMGYASDVVGTLRGALSERHGLVLEWMIILLIAVEVGFEVNRLWKEREERRKAERGRAKGEGKEIERGVVSAEISAAIAALAGESGEVDLDKVRELEGLVERQRKLLNALESMDNSRDRQAVSSMLASSSQSQLQSQSPEPTLSLAKQPIQALTATE